MKQNKLCVFGEVLFDHFPDGKRVLGGAPFNVAWHLQAFGQTPCFISRIGDDPDGKEVITAMHDWGMSTHMLQIDPDRPTGRVNVSFDNGEPSYEIAEQCAYDAIETTPDEINCRLLYHGSLALRDHTSLQTLESIKANQAGIVFIDVNLRTPWWQKHSIEHMLGKADWVKLNHEELNLLSSGSGSTETTIKARHFLKNHNLKGLLLTHGSEGAELLTADDKHFRIRPKENISVVDTVGAGDAFTSIMILGLAHHWPLDITLERAQNFASELVGRRGATVNDLTFYNMFIQHWELKN